MAHVEVRCPVSGRMFGVVQVGSVPGGSTFEIACRECKRAEGVWRVIHCYDGSGVLVDTIVLDIDPSLGR